MFPLITPLADIYLFSLIISIVFYYLEKHFLKTRPSEKEQKETKKLRKELQKISKEKNLKKSQELQKKLMELQFSQMQKSFSPKTLIFRMLPYSFFIIFLRNHYQTFGIILDLNIIQFQWLGSFIFFFNSKFNNY
jgi:uncharacterized membrane protein (DUF106 family)